MQGQVPESFVHDPAGNILSITEGGGDSGETASAQVSQQSASQVQGNRLAFQGDTHYKYDALGNRVAQGRGKNQSIRSFFRYNALNQLTDVKTDKQHTQYAYDPLGRRIVKAVGKDRTDFLWMEDVLLSETALSQEQAEEGSPPTEKLYLFEPGTFKPLAMVQNKSVYHYHLDHLGTPQEITDSAGKVVWAVSYKAYGSLALAYESEIENNIRFQGQYFDEESGLHYNRFRYYDPSAGRFISQDPIGLLGGVNNYQYAPNPVNWVDPYGLTAKDCPPKTNSWNTFQKDTKGHFANSGEASKSYQKMKEVEAMDNASRPDSPSSYLPKSYLDAHQQKFDSEGGAFIVVEGWTTGSRYPTLPPRKFVGLRSEMDKVVQKFESTGDVRVLNDELNLGLNKSQLSDLDKDNVMYVQIEPGDPRFTYEMPSGREFGAIPNEWVPGGKTKSGTSEAALVGAEKVDHGKSLDGYAKEFKNTRIIKD